MKKLVLSGQKLTIDDVIDVAFYHKKVLLDPIKAKELDNSFYSLENSVLAGNKIYGVTTGFGSFSEIAIPPEENSNLQRKLILSHAQGLGDYFPEAIVRIMLLLRAQTLVKNYSGVRGELVNYILHFLNHNLCPIVPKYGSVGASGDLIPLAHLTQPILGEGKVIHKNKIISGSEALNLLNLQPYNLRLKEGIALINGTQAMLSLLIYSYIHGLKLWRSFNLSATMSMEALRSSTSFLDDIVFITRPHDGVKETILDIKSNLEGSRLINPPQLHRVQEAYSIRCIPQVHGTTYLALSKIKDIIDVEINSVTDNPLIVPDEKNISQGNFHGAPLAWAADSLAIALSYLGSMSERRVDKLLSGTYEKSLTSYLAERPGIDNGLMLLQYQAASLVNYLKILTHPASVDSIPTAQGQEDHVSMGMNSSLKLLELIEKLYSLASIELYISHEAVSRQGIDNSGVGSNYFSKTFKKILSPFNEDRSVVKEIEEIKKVISTYP